jgi:predicted DCC family thiol-disulfide oxidoreductase YuxK
MEKSIVLFDGVCNFCNSAVNFIIKRDKKKRYVFGPLQSEQGQKLLIQYNLPVDKLSTFILIENGKTYNKSGAALRIARRLSGLWPMLYPLIVLPAFIRDIVYNIIAKNRYRWFGRMDQCMMPTSELRARFLGS